MNIAGLLTFPQVKIWGLTAQLFAESGVEVHRIEVKPWHRCSQHRHDRKFNTFYVESGELRVVTRPETRTERDDFWLEPGRTVTVAPGVEHYFETGEKPTVAYEIYWTKMDGEDIVRLCPGGPVPVERK